MCAKRGDLPRGNAGYLHLISGRRRCEEQATQVLRGALMRPLGSHQGNFGGFRPITPAEYLEVRIFGQHESCPMHRGGGRGWL